MQVKDHRQRLLGVGFHNAKSKIQVRMLASERVEIDESFFRRQIESAHALRQRYLPGAGSFRLVNSEGDLLSGLIVDKYEDVLVLQTLSLGMDMRKAQIVAALQAMFAPTAIVERNDVVSRKFEGLAETTGVLAGVVPEKTVVTLNGLKFETSLMSGHKTGMYLDQQVNYRAATEIVGKFSGARVLDCFSFLGGFGLHAARAGAAQVHMLDQSEEAVGAAKRNAQLNGLENVCSAEAVNVFDWLKRETTPRPNEMILPRFDLIILDPPSFTRNRASVGDALRGYKEIHLRALKLLRPGGVLATFCCSHHVTTELFQDVILSAAFDARKVLRRVGMFGQSPDHPVLPSIPETEYLKGFAFEIAR